jgi:hypothetical protein
VVIAGRLRCLKPQSAYKNTATCRHQFAATQRTSNGCAVRGDIGAAGRREVAEEGVHPPKMRGTSAQQTPIRRYVDEALNFE